MPDIARADITGRIAVKDKGLQAAALWRVHGREAVVEDFYIMYQRTKSRQVRVADIRPQANRSAGYDVILKRIIRHRPVIMIQIGARRAIGPGTDEGVARDGVVVAAMGTEA